MNKAYARLRRAGDIAAKNKNKLPLSQLAPWFSHGDFVGPGWSDGKAQESVAGYATARDAFDQTAKDHDRAYANKGNLHEADIEFAKQNIGQGATRTIAGLAVGAQGIARAVGGTDKKRFRGTDITPNPNKKPKTDGNITGKKRPAVTSIGKGLNKKLFTNPDPDSPDDPASLSKMPTPAAHNNGDDVPVVPPPAKIAKHVPDYTTTIMTYFDYVDLENTAANTETLAKHFIRLNSIYDVTPSAAGTAVTTDVDGLLAHAPAGRAPWESIYKYYRVLSTDVSLTFMNNSTINYNTAGVVDYMKCAKIVGYQPVEGTGANEQVSQWYHWVEKKHTRTELMNPGYIDLDTVATNVNLVSVTKGLPQVVKMEYHYEPAKWDYHVTDNAEDERWTLLTTAPIISRNLCIMAGSVCPPPAASDYRTNYSIRCYYHIKYTVQLRELKDDLLFATSTRPSTGD